MDEKIKKGGGKIPPPIVYGLSGAVVLTLGQTTSSLILLHIPLHASFVPVLFSVASGAGGTWYRLSWTCFCFYRFFLTCFSFLFSPSG
jgi:hypothetical protein